MPPLNYLKLSIKSSTSFSTKEAKISGHKTRNILRVSYLELSQLSLYSSSQVSNPVFEPVVSFDIYPIRRDVQSSHCLSWFLNIDKIELYKAGTLTKNFELSSRFECVENATRSDSALTLEERS